jgi:D-alanyl-lipoteichoic acid acyltransferase DltB (MBOAT superfamily)
MRLDKIERCNRTPLTGRTHVVSFSTFAQIVLLVDVYRREGYKANIMRYTLFVTYSPHLIAGPLLHHRPIMPQLSPPISILITAASAFLVFVSLLSPFGTTLRARVSISNFDMT